MSEMTTEQALEAIRSLDALQSDRNEAYREIDEFPYPRCMETTLKLNHEAQRADFAGIASVIERLKEENAELKSRMPAVAFSDEQLFGAKPQGRL